MWRQRPVRRRCGPTGSARYLCSPAASAALCRRPSTSACCRRARGVDRLVKARTAALQQANRPQQLLRQAVAACFNSIVIIRAKSPGYPINVAYYPAGRRLANDVARGARFAIDSAGAAYRLAAGELAGMRDAMLAATAGSARISQLQQLGERKLLAWFKVAGSLLAAFGTDLVNLPMIRTANGRSGDAIMLASS
jgi:hypothetical protein